MKAYKASYIGAILIIFLVFVLSFGLWTLGKKISYNVCYEKMVQQTVKEMVKPEALK